MYTTNEELFVTTGVLSVLFCFLPCFESAKFYSAQFHQFFHEVSIRFVSDQCTIYCMLTETLLATTVQSIENSFAHHGQMFQIRSVNVYRYIQFSFQFSSFPESCRYIWLSRHFRFSFCCPPYCMRMFIPLRFSYLRGINQ